MGITYGRLVENAYNIQVPESKKRGIPLERIRQAVRNNCFENGQVLYEPWQEIPDSYVRGFSRRVENVINGFLH